MDDHGVLAIPFEKALTMGAAQNPLIWDHYAVDQLEFLAKRFREEAHDREDAIRRLSKLMGPFVRFILRFEANPLNNVADEFYTIHGGTEHEAVLRLSEFRRLLTVFDGGLMGTPRCPRCGKVLQSDDEKERDLCGLCLSHVIAMKKRQEAERE